MLVVIFGTFFMYKPDGLHESPDKIKRPALFRIVKYIGDKSPEEREATPALYRGYHKSTI